VLGQGIVRGGSEVKAQNLLKKMAGKQEDLVYAGFNILRDNSRQVQNFNRCKSNALTNLCTVQAVSTELAFQKLVQNARLESTKADSQIKILKGLAQKVANACQSKLTKALDNLARHAVLIRDSHNTAISNITKHIVAQDSKCLCLCYFALKRAVFVDDGVKLGSARTKKDKLVRSLVERQCSLEYMAFWLLRNNSGYLIVKEQEQAKVIALGNDSRNMALISFVKNQIISLDLAFRKLLGNAEFSSQASKNQKQLRNHLINRLLATSQTLPAIALSKLLHHNQTVSTSQTTKLKSFTNLLSKVNLSSLNLCYQSLKASQTLANGIFIGKTSEKKNNLLSQLNSQICKKKAASFKNLCENLKTCKKFEENAVRVCNWLLKLRNVNIKISWVKLQQNCREKLLMDQARMGKIVKMGERLGLVNDTLVMVGWER
jgi:hypothetical protein